MEGFHQDIPAEIAALYPGGQVGSHHSNPDPHAQPDKRLQLGDHKGFCPGQKICQLIHKNKDMGKFRNSSASPKNMTKF